MDTDYRMSHRPPDPEDGAPAHDLTGGGAIYPENVYSADGARIYGGGEPEMARRVHSVITSMRGNPNAKVQIYRAVPKGTRQVNVGDWVTIDREYAEQHGQSNLNNDYDILSNTVNADEIYTDGNSLFEWSYHPRVQKHLAGQHDQITHGSWAGRGLAPNIVEDMKSYYGTTFEEFKNSEAFKRISEKTVQAHVTNTNVGDVNLEFVAEKQGFDGKPKVVTSEQMDALEKDGWTIAYRGIVDGETISGDPISADAIVDEFINGKYYGGRGTSGNGTYFAESKEVAEYYAQGGSTTPVPMFGQSGVRSGRVIKVAIPKGTMMSAFDFQDAVVEHRENVKNKKLWWNGDDIGVALAAQGYRGTEQIRGLPMNPSEAYKVYVIWDRSMLAVEEIK
jgi:hypothetical protein